LNERCGLTQQYDEVCENPKAYPALKSMIDPENVQKGSPQDGVTTIYVVACGATVPDAKAAFSLLGLKMFNPYICPMCTATWKSGCSHEHKTCPTIDHSDTIAHLAGLVNVVAVEFQQQVKLEVYLYNARKFIPEILQHVEELAYNDDDDGTAFRAGLRKQGELLLPVCKEIKTDVQDGRVLLDTLRKTCTNLAQHLNPDPLVGPDSDPTQILIMLDDEDLKEAHVQAGGDV
jgi:hypothetical protein